MTDKWEVVDKLAESKHIWYDKTPLMSRNGFINFVLGARGTGKTFCFKEWAIKKPNPTVWVRRYQEDIDDLKDKFLGDLIATGKLNPETQNIKIDGDKLIIDDEVKIFFMALTTSARKKSQSYFLVDAIIYDEVFEMKGGRRYLPNEVEKFLELVETVNRLRVDGRKEVRCFLLANKTTFVNPYFTYWNILPFSERFKTFKDGLIVVENYENETFKELKKQTNFGKLIDGTTYGNYAIDNIAWMDDDAYIVDKKPEKSRLLCNIRYKDLYIGLWDAPEGVYCMRGHNKNRMTFTTKFEVGDDEYPLVPTRQPMKYLNTAFTQGILYFEDNVCKEAIYSIIQQGGKLNE